ncbi:MAG: bifunctional 2-C-methyl-D-erythritol 4-phosphate cytidylyltransferase/2-C-methyl-D-erythritol 2,4-cyclodiphosphate synthase [Sphingomonas sp.]|nr:MAG: bifunctional 2-C-methyl-D-erythritol 4-phosphate cytidylyltransferase/2-C-methyl-D-erythritol 2,4-cyclodiphosphate synthase [Sphingomonas sp.]
MSSTAQPRPAAALIVAAGRSLRAGGEVPKQYRTLGGKPILRWSAEAFARHTAIGPIHVVVAEGEEARAAELLDGLPASVGRGGATRQESVRLGLEQLADTAPAQVLIHDAARPLLAAELIDRVLDGLADAPGSCPALPLVDSLRRGGDKIEGEVPREGLWRVQTPQGFDFALIRAAHATASEGATDDAEVLRAAGHEVRLVPGDEKAMKVTLPQDFETAERLLDWVTLSGSGYDVHKFGPGDHVWLCGVPVPHSHGLIGHSDADVGLHALTDAILGALGDGDIGTHFPPSDPQWKGASSDRFLAHAASLVAAAGGHILHVDVTLICEAPKVGPHRPAMVARLAEILHDHAPRISVKATTTEGLGFTGRREGLAAQALATIRLPGWSKA